MANEIPLYQGFERSWAQRAGRAACGAAVAVAAALAAGPGPAAEAPPEAVAAAGIAMPLPRVERHRDWMLDCTGACRVETVVRGAEDREVMRLAVAAEAPATLAVATPLPLFLPEPVEIGVGDAALSLPWLTCDPGGCEARAALDAGLLAGLRRERAAQVAFTLLDGSRVRVPVSLMGFTSAKAALDARADWPSHAPPVPPD
jgi:invasion protein IalB